MNSYTDDELESLSRARESDAAEFQDCCALDALERVREAVCAFANDLPGRGRPGLVVIGLRDDGTSAQLAITDELERQLSDIRTDRREIISRGKLLELACEAGFDSDAVLAALSDDGLDEEPVPALIEE